MLRVGSNVVIDNLAARADLNGSIGVVHRYNEAQQRWNVAVDGEPKKLAIKESSLTVLAEWSWATGTDTWRPYDAAICARLEAAAAEHGDDAEVELTLGGKEYVVKHDGTSWIQQRADNPKQEDDSPRDPNPDEGWDDDGEVYDAYQDVDDAYYEDEGEAEAVCYGGAVIEDLD